MQKVENRTIEFFYKTIFIGKELVRKNVTWLLRYGLNKFLIHINIPNFIFNHLKKKWHVLVSIEKIKHVL